MENAPKKKSRDMVMANIHAVGKKHNADTVGHEKDIEAVLNTPAIAKVFQLIDQASPSAKAEGNKILAVVLSTVQGMNDTVAQAMGSNVDPMVVRVQKAIEYALTGTLPS